MRRAARKDLNHNEVADVYRAHGWSVAETYQLGNGFPDLVVAKDGVTRLIEIKDRRGTLTMAELTFAAQWRGECVVIRSVDEAIADANHG